MRCYKCKEVTHAHGYENFEKEAALWRRLHEKMRARTYGGGESNNVCRRIRLHGQCEKMASRKEKAKCYTMVVAAITRAVEGRAETWVRKGVA